MQGKGRKPAHVTKCPTYCHPERSRGIYFNTPAISRIPLSPLTLLFVFTPYPFFLCGSLISLWQKKPSRQRLYPAKNKRNPRLNLPLFLLGFSLAPLRDKILRSTHHPSFSWLMIIGYWLLFIPLFLQLPLTLLFVFTVAFDLNFTPYPLPLTIYTLTLPLSPFFSVNSMPRWQNIFVFAVALDLIFFSAI